MQDAYDGKMRQIAAQNASRQARKGRTRVKAAQAPAVNPLLIGLGMLSVLIAAFFSLQSL